MRIQLESAAAIKVRLGTLIRYLPRSGRADDFGHFVQTTLENDKKVKNHSYS